MTGIAMHIVEWQQWAQWWTINSAEKKIGLTQVCVHAAKATMWVNNMCPPRMAAVGCNNALGSLRQSLWFIGDESGKTLEVRQHRRWNSSVEHLPHTPNYLEAQTHRKADTQLADSSHIMGFTLNLTHKDIRIAHGDSCGTYPADAEA